jgi:predicted small lipoprotein YifL
MKITSNKKSIFIMTLVLCIGLAIAACGHKGDPRPPEAMIMAPGLKN